MRHRMSDAVWNAIIFVLSVLVGGLLTWGVWILLVNVIVCLGIGGFVAVVIASIF